jgi:fumarate reductase subunit C
MTAILFIAQRASAAVLAFAVTVHLATILYAVRGGLTAGEVLARTRDNQWFFAVYVLLVLAVAVHAPIGLRNVISEWTPWRGRSLDIALALFALVLLLMGFRAAAAVYLPPEAIFG